MASSREPPLGGFPTDLVARGEWLERVERWDPVGLVLLAHGGVLLYLESVSRPAETVVLLVALALWRAGTGVAIARLATHRSSLGLARGAGSLILIAGVMAADGGTESPFFFWPLVLLAWQALHMTARQLAIMSGVTVAAYVGVVLAVSDVTPTSMARLGLLGAFAGILMIGRLQIDHHRRVAEQSEQLLKDAFSVAPVGLMVVAPNERRPLYANRAAISMRLGRLMPDPGEDGDTLRRIVETAWSGRQTMGPEVVKLSISGSKDRYIRLAATPHVGGGTPLVVVGAEDVTQQVAVGEERRSFLRFAGHQMRTPLTPIIAYAELLQSGHLSSEEVEGAAREVENAARELLRLCERMLAVAELQYETRSSIGVTSMSDILRHLGSSVLHDVELRGDPRDRVLCNAGLIAQALAELIENGHRFGVPPIRMEWQRQGEETEIRVWDAGPGPDPGTSEDALFAEWGRLTAAEMMSPGMRSRLGLVQARLLANLSEGDLAFERYGSEWAFVLRLASPVSAGSSTERQRSYALG